MGRKEHERMQLAALSLYATKRVPLNNLTKEMISEAVKSSKCEIDSIEVEPYYVIVYFRYGPVAGGWPSDLLKIQDKILSNLAKKGYMVRSGPYRLTVDKQKRE